MIEIVTKAIVEIISAAIPIRRIRRSIRGKLLRYRISLLFRMRVKPQIKRLRMSNKRIRVGFLVVYDSCFQMESVYQAMLADKAFDPRIYVIPDVSRGEEFCKRTLSHTFNSLCSKYGSDKVAIPIENGVYQDIVDKFDICTTMNPYSSLTHKYYSIPYLSTKGVPVFFSKYYFENGEIWAKSFYGIPELHFLWRFYLENDSIRAMVVGGKMLSGMDSRVLTVGYPKTDLLREECKRVRHRDRARVIIAPHHSIDPNAEYNIGNFVTYKELFLRLPSLYPQIDWVFRPHPLLMINMITLGYWTKEEKDKYLCKMTKYPNVEYQDGGEYFPTFADSDAMIQDCGSFLPEYFFANHPQCFILRDKNHAVKMFPTEWGQLLLDNVYQAYSEKDLLQFVDKVVVGGDDYMAQHRKQFFNKNLDMAADVKCAESIISDIKKQLNREL